MLSKTRTFTAFLAAAIFSAPNFAFAAEGAPHEWQWDLPQAATPIMESIRSFNVLLTAVIISIVMFVSILLAYVMIRFRESANPVPSKTSHNTAIEVLWTIVPVLILVLIAIPSFRLLYFQYSFPKADVTIKATGKQWYWSYEYPDAKGVSFDSYPIDDKDIQPGQIKRLSVDNEVVVPVNKVVHMLITGGDVIHQWVVPAFGARGDGIPGRVNRQWFLVRETGVYYGECSALCGNGHPYMPIAVRAVSDEDYAKWIAEKQRTASAGNAAVASAEETVQPKEQN